MQANAFINQIAPPDEAGMAAALGARKALWDQLVADLKKDCEMDTEEWKCYSPKHGWSLRLLRKKRNILYLSPCVGSFRVMFILGDKAMTAVRACKWSTRMVKIINETPKYPEGTGIRIDGVGPRDIPTIKKLAQIKLQS